MAAASDRPQLRTSERARGSDDVPPLVAAGGKFEGVVSCRDGVLIDGELVGEIAAQGRIELGESSQVSGTIRAAEIIVAGRFEGTLVASGKIELLATARVSGNLTTAKLVAREGCTIQGSCAMGPSADETDQPHSSS
jgi:cytoskeletal protein CcmA (bactofilin family)